jgi:hypothetical protein
MDTSIAKRPNRHSAVVLRLKIGSNRSNKRHQPNGIRFCVRSRAKLLIGRTILVGEPLMPGQARAQALAEIAQQIISMPLRSDHEH